MRLATVLTPMSDENLALAAQCGVTDIVMRYVGPKLDDLIEVKRRIESFGLLLSVVEGYLPIENIKIGRDDGSEIRRLKSLVHDMGELGVETLCYNFMAGTDWVRTRLDVPERGGARLQHLTCARLNEPSSWGMTVLRQESFLRRPKSRPTRCGRSWTRS